MSAPSFKPAYLIHGDDHGRIGERRSNLRRLAETTAGANGVEGFEGEAATPEAIAAALSAMTFAMGHRFLVVDGVERWKEAEVTQALAPVLAAMPPDTTVAFFASEDARAKAPKALIDAVTKAGGVIATERMLKAKELPRWVVAEAAKLHLDIEGSAALALIEMVGERQQRLLRELEKLALEHGAGARIGLEEVQGAAAPSAEHQIWGLGDALVARDRDLAIRTYLELREQGEALPRLIPAMARRIREVHLIAARLGAGQTASQVKEGLRMSPWMIDKRIKEARASDVDALRAALTALADLELTSRGMDEQSEDTAAIRAIEQIAA